MTTRPSRHIPDAWPRGMRDDVAAAYVGLSRSTFLREVQAGAAPEPCNITNGRRIWLRDQLDDWLDELFGVERPSGTAEDWMKAVRGDQAGLSLGNDG